MFPSIIALVLLACSFGAYAAPLTIERPFISLINTANNSLGWAAGPGPALRRRIGDTERLRRYNRLCYRRRPK